MSNISLKWAILPILALIIGIVFVVGVWEHSTLKTYTFKVNNLAAVSTNDSNGHKYMVYTDQGTFQDTDSIFFGKFNSSDLYGSLTVGKSYTCKTIGVRIPFLSSYRNLISCSAA